MPFPKKRKPLQFTEEELRTLASIRKSRSEEKRRSQRASFLLDSFAGQGDQAIARQHQVGRSTVVRCVQKCLEFGLEAVLAELPRPGKPRQLPDDAIAWVQNCACQKPKDLGYSYELWTYRLLTAHVRQHCVSAGHPVLRQLSRSKLHKILRQGELRPHKIRYYVENRDPAFETKIVPVLHVYKEVQIVNEYLQGEVGKHLGMVTISYDEKPGIQALAVTTPDRPPVPGQHASHLRDSEYKRLGTVSLWAGLDLHTGRIIETVSDTHKSADFIAFLKKLDGAYPGHQKIRLVLDNHSAHISYIFAYLEDGNGNIVQTTITDPRGNVTQYSFDTNSYFSGGNITQIIRALNTPLQKTWTYQYQPSTNLLVSQTDGLDRQTTFAYD